MKNSVTMFASVCLMLGATGVQASVITEVVRNNGYPTPTVPPEPEIVPGGLQDDAKAYVDRDFVWTDVPPELVGADYVKTFNNDKRTEEVSYAVTLSSAAKLYIMMDYRYLDAHGSPPFEWMCDGSSGAVFTDTGLDMYQIAGAWRYKWYVYEAVVSAGTYTLGAAYSKDGKNSFYGIAAFGLGAEIEIKPETLNLKSEGVFTAFIDLPEGYDEEEVDISTVECQGAPAVSGVMADDDRLIIKLDREDLVGVTAGDAVELIVTGQLLDGIVFSGSDTIRVISKGGKK